MNSDENKPEMLQGIDRAASSGAVNDAEETTNLHDLLNQAPAAIAILRGKHHTFEFANPMYMQLIGKEREIVGKTLAEALPEIKGQGFIKILNTLRQTGKPYLGMETHVMLDRNETGELEDSYLNFVYQPIKDAQGEVEGVFVHAVDITEQVIARQRVEVSEEKYRTLFDSIDEGFCVIEVLFDEHERPVDYRFLEVNPAFERQTGLENAIGRRMLEFAPDMETYWFDHYGKVALTGEAVRFEDRAEQLKRFYDVFAFRIGEPAERKVAVLFNDISQRKNAEAERDRLLKAEQEARHRAEESEQKYRTLFDTMDQGFCILEMIFDAHDHPIDYRFIEINPTFEAQTGLKDAIGKTARELVPNLEQRWFDIYGKVALTGVSSRFIDGSEAMGRWFEVYAFRIGGADSRRVALLFTNITERKLAEEENRRLLEAERTAREELERANQAKLLFLAMISHELRTPLTSIKGFASTLLANDVEWDAGSQRDFIQIIEEEADKLQSLIEELLDLSRLQNGTFSVIQTPVLPGEIFREAELQMLSLGEKHNIGIDIPPMMPAIFADPGRIVQVITNLVSNAAKYSPTGTHIHVSVEIQDGWVEFSVSDEGMGIPQDKRLTVFEPFYQLEGGKKGIGLGLAICKGIVDAHGGRIWIADKSTPGTTISFTLPVVR